MAQKKTIHETLAKSYLAYFVASLAGLFIDAFVFAPFQVPFAMPITIVLFGLGPILMFWAQYTSNRCEREHHLHEQYFVHGPYRFVRNPTHLGLLMLVTGYTLISGSIIFFFTTLLGYLISNIFFTKYESILGEKYGEQYQQYKSKTPKIL